MTTNEPDGNVAEDEGSAPSATQHTTLKYSLLGPSLLKAGQDSVDQSKVRGPRSPQTRTNDHG